MMALQQIVAMLVTFFIPRILLSVYGSEINGLVVSITQFISYFLLVEAGISGASVYALYKPLADNDIPRINAILSAARHFYLQSGYIFLALVFVLAVAYPFFAKTVELPAWQVALIVFAIGGKGTMDFFSLSKYRVLLTASQRSYVISAAQIVFWILTAVIVWLLARYQVQIVWLQCCLVLPIFVRSFLLQQYTKRRFVYVDYQVEPDKSSIKDRWNVLYLQLLGSAQSAIPVIWATVFTSLKEVSVFAIYNMVMSGITNVLSIFVSGLAASFGDVIAKGERKILQKSNQEFEQAYYMLITVVHMVALVLLLSFVALYTKGIHDVNYILPGLGFLFVLNGFLNNLKTPQGMLVISAGMYRQTRWQSTVQGLIIVICGAIGGYLWGLYGIVGGLVLSNLYRDIDLLFFVPKHITKLSYKRTLRHIWPAVICFAGSIVYFLWIPIKIDTFGQWVIYGVVYTLAASILVLAANLVADFQNMCHIGGRLKKFLVRTAHVRN